jgi:hypothetical protein
MKIHTTNYINTFIEIADDCPENCGVIPPTKGENKSVANLQFEMVMNNPYKYTSDEVFFEIYAIRNEIPENELNSAKEVYFSKGQPCFRASPLTKRYGWGLHSNNEGKIALFGSETKEYNNFVNDNTLQKVKAMKSKR